MELIYSKITGTGSVLPNEPISNNELVERLKLKGVETSDAWIRERTGITQRYFAHEGQTASDLGAIAARHAMSAAGVIAEQIDLIIVATSTPDMVFPSTACLLQAKIGADHAAAFDVQAVCSGFVYALATADAMIKAGQARTALVIGAEVFSRLLDWSDRTTCVLFGDGAGAVVLQASETSGILANCLHSNGKLSHILYTQGQGGDPFLKMDGSAVFKQAITVLGDVAQEVLTKSSINAYEIDWLIPHQANYRILQATAKRLNIEMNKVISTVGAHGNTSAASIPLALDVAVRDGRIKEGHLVLLQGVGGGFTWGANLVRM